MVRQYEYKRMNRIAEIKASIEKALAEGREVDYKALRLYLMGTYGISSRTSLEYIEVAKSLVNEA